ncbi:unnamed protein product [Chondrus crispus]|uniref:Amine oxidase domain-containing protein n=1 Tax=Chondrus crispus TaxID=2769 RepID=R7QBB9_CHOCR|nr:unnamed protein product [Chondrus crispus]CDF35053.1 unnamed protein product [Chondrus crispus]|eukprot:XP_005714872.1 unnamed protein product [Chondrus crispus]
MFSRILLCFCVLLCLIELIFAAVVSSPVLIIGAGTAGATVALELSKQSIPFILFEATDRVGGRLRREPLGGGLSVELGGMSLQGFRRGVPFHDFVRKFVGLKAVAADYDDVYFVSNGTLVPDKIADQAWTLSEKALASAYRLQGKYDMDIRSAVEFSGIDIRSPIETAAWRFEIDFEYAVGAEAVSLNGLSPIFAPDAPRSRDRFVTDQRGYGYAVEVILQMAGVKDTTRSNDKLRLNTPVDTVRYSEESAQVVLRNGEIYNGSAVVSTVSAGVLKEALLREPPSASRLNFDPPLRRRKRLAIAKIVMGDYMKIFVQFKEPVFTDEDPLFLIPLSCDIDGFLKVQNLNKRGYFPAENIVLVTSTDEYSRELECESKEKVLRDVLHYLSAAAGKVLSESDVIGLVASNFRRKPFFKGSFSVRAPSVTDDDIKQFNKPVNSLFFAGEAHRMGEGLNGYVHGAWDSAVDTTKQLIEFVANRK